MFRELSKLVNMQETKIQRLKEIIDEYTFKNNNLLNENKRLTNLVKYYNNAKKNKFNKSFYKTLFKYRKNNLFDKVKKSKSKSQKKLNKTLSISMEEKKPLLNKSIETDKRHRKSIDNSYKINYKEAPKTPVIKRNHYTKNFIIHLNEFNQFINQTNRLFMYKSKIYSKNKRNKLIFNKVKSTKKNYSCFDFGKNVEKSLDNLLKNLKKTSI